MYQIQCIFIETMNIFISFIGESYKEEQGKKICS